MKPNQTFRYTVFALLVLGAFGMVSCGHQHADKEEEHHHEEGHADEIVLTEHQMKQAGVATERVEAADFTHVIRVGGQLLSSVGDEQTVVATASGIVTFANASVTEGAAVVAGQTIATISARQLQDGDATQKARIACEAARQAYVRAQGLAADKIISQRELEQAKAEYETARAALGAAAEKGESAMVVAAPIAGYVKSRMVRQGDYVQVGDPIMTVTKNRKLQLRADVPETYYREIRQVSGANFRVGADKMVYRLADLHGRLVACGRASADNAYTVPVTFEFDNVGDFVSGAFAEVFLLGKSVPGVISVPVTALTESQGVYYVFVAVKDEHGAFVKQEVAIGRDNGERVEITQGLKAGDEVVVKGATQVRLAGMSGAIPEGHNHNH